jgi:SAM-dependent methyltransferase
MSPAERWGALWGARAEDWSVTEEQQRPGYEAVLAHVAPAPGARVLDVGCGAGAFLRVVADRGLRPSGLDASSALADLARARVPEADVRTGDMEALPYDDDTFDLVTGLTSFFFAGDMVAALREAARVAKPGAPVVTGVWGRPERCDIEAMKRVIRPFLPGSPEAPAPLWRPGVLETMAREAGLRPRTAFDVDLPYRYPEARLARLVLAPAGLATLIGPDREDDVAAQIAAALAPFRDAEGTYVLHNEFHHLVATAP